VEGVVGKDKGEGDNLGGFGNLALIVDRLGTISAVVDGKRIRENSVAFKSEVVVVTGGRLEVGVVFDPDIAAAIVELTRFSAFPEEFVPGRAGVIWVAN